MAISPAPALRPTVATVLPFVRTAAVAAGGAELRAHHRNDIIVVTVDGYVDATNVERVNEYAHAFLRTAPRLIIDLSRVEFFCAGGGVILAGLNTECQEADVPWALVSSRAVDRVLRIVSAAAPVPVAETLSAALGMLENRKLA